MALSQTVLLWLGTIALAIDYVGTVRADNRETRIVTLGFAFAFWVAFTLTATNFRIVTNSVVYSQSGSVLVVLGLLGAALTMLFVIEAVMRSVTEAR